MNEQREKALKQLEEIRNTGKYNMMNRSKVLQYAVDNQMHALVAEVGKDSSEYLRLLREMGDSQ